MKSAYEKLTVDVIGIATEPWSSGLELLCQSGITPFFVMDQTARSGP
jgi:hypothetical protein